MSGRLELLAPNRYVRERVEDVYLLRIAELVAEIDEDGHLDGVDLVVGSRERQPGTPLAAPRRTQDDDQFAETVDGRAAGAQRGGRKASTATATHRRDDQPQGLNPGFVFDAFVGGQVERLCQGRGMASCGEPGQILQSRCCSTVGLGSARHT